MNMEQPVRQTASEQLSYAEVLHWSIVLGFIVLVVTFAAYVLGWLPSYVPLERLPQLWGLSSTEYLKATGIPTGWSWLFMMGKGDFASQLGIAILSGCSIACIIAIMPAYARTRNFIYIGICILEIAVLVLSASGIFGH
jgi:hypothetical protein